MFGEQENSSVSDMGLDLLLNPKVSEAEPRRLSSINEYRLPPESQDGSEDYGGGNHGRDHDKDDEDDDVDDDDDDENENDIENGRGYGGDHEDGTEYYDGVPVDQNDEENAFDRERQRDEPVRQPPPKPNRKIPKPAYVPPSGASSDEIKRDLLYQFDRLQKKGYKLHRRFSMASSLDDMHAEYERLIRDKKMDASIRMQQNCLMGFVNLVEMVDSRFMHMDMDGWAESVHSNINDYDDTFEELALKYSGSGHIAPEIRLIMMLAMSGFTFHMSKRLAASVPGLDKMFEHNPALKKQFASTAASMMQSTSSRMSKQQAPQAEEPQADPMSTVMKMVGSMFGSGGAGGAGGGGVGGGGGNPGPSRGGAAGAPTEGRMRGPRASPEEVKNFVRAKENPDRFEVVSQSEASEISGVFSLGDEKPRRRRGKSSGVTLDL